MYRKKDLQSFSWVLVLTTCAHTKQIMKSSPYFVPTTAEKETQTVITKHFTIITTLNYILHEKLLTRTLVVSSYKTKQKTWSRITYEQCDTAGNMKGGCSQTSVVPQTIHCICQWSSTGQDFTFSNSQWSEFIVFVT